MANNPKIEVEIGANVQGLQAGVAQADKAIDKLATSSSQAAPQINKLTRATSNYNSVGIEFSRIIQDAPFGIIGVANNITQLTQSLQNGRAAGQSYGQLLKGIFTSGNTLVLGISLLTSAFVILQQKGFFKSTQSAKDLDDQLKEYQETLKGVSAATLKGAQDSQKEIASLTALRLQVENTAVSQGKRLEAVNALQKEYPAYFGNLTKEQILNGEVGEAYTLVTKALIAKAQAQASINKIAENSIKLLTIQTKLEEIQGKRLIETAQAQGQLDALIQRRQQDGFLNQGDIARYDELLRRLNNATDSYSEEILLLTEKESILDENNKLTENTNRLLSEGVFFTKEQNSGTKESIKLEDELIKRIEFTNKLRADSAKRFQELVSGILPNQSAIQDVGFNISGPPVIEIPQIDESSLTAFILRLQEFNNEVSGILENGVEQTIGDFAFAIGDALASGSNVLEASGAALLGGLAQVMNQLGQLAIGTGVAIGGIKKALQTLNPAVAIGAGVALIALAGVVSAKAKSLGSFGGGSGGVSGVGTSGISQGTSFTGQGGGSTGFNRDLTLRGEFRIDGNDLVYVIDQSRASQI